MTDFFNLSVEERDRLTAIHTKQNRIRSVSASIKQQLDVLNQEYRANQQDCLHPFAKKMHNRSDGYGEDPHFTTNFYCPDCDKNWTEEGSK